MSCSNLKYLFFHFIDFKDILKGLEVKPVFRKYAHCEIIAEAEGVLLGKCDALVFIIVKDKDFDLDLEPLYSVNVEITKLKNGKNFKYGRYAFEEDLKIDATFDEKLFYDYIPSILSYIVTTEILLKEIKARSEHLSERESEIVRELMILSEEAKTLNEEKLEEISMKISELRTSFFTSYLRLKGTFERAFESITHARTLSLYLDGFLKEKVNELLNELNVLRNYESRFEQTLNGVRDALNVVHLRLEMLRSKENLELQKRTSALQAAAAIVEFVAVFYYTMKVWETFLPVEEMPPQISFLLLAFFATAVVVYTDVLAEFIREKKLNKKFLLSSITLLIILILMAVLPLLFSHEFHSL